MAISNEVLILGTALILSALLILKKSGAFGNSDSFELIKTPTLSGQGYWERSPVDYMFGDLTLKADGTPLTPGQWTNPEHISLPGDDMQELEYGVDFHLDAKKLDSGRIFEEFDMYGPYAGRGTTDFHLINDSKTRGDLINNGDMEYNRILTNMSNEHYKDAIVPPYIATATEADQVNARAISHPQQNLGLYSPSYHRPLIGLPL